GASEGEQQKCGINVPSPPQRAADHAVPALALTCPAVGQRAGHTRDEHEHFHGIAEAVVPQCQPASDVVGDMIKKDAPQRDTAAGIDTQVATKPLELRRYLADQWLRGVSSIMHLVTYPVRRMSTLSVGYRSMKHSSGAPVGCRAGRRPSRCGYEARLPNGWGFFRRDAIVQTATPIDWTGRIAGIPIRSWDFIASSRQKKLFPHFGEAGTAIFAVKQVEYSGHDRTLV